MIALFVYKITYVIFLKERRRGGIQGGMSYIVALRICHFVFLRVEYGLLLAKTHAGTGKTLPCCVS